MKEIFTQAFDCNLLRGIHSPLQSMLFREAISKLPKQVAVAILPSPGICTVKEELKNMMANSTAFAALIPMFLALHITGYIVKIN